MTTLIQITDLHLVAQGPLPTGVDPAASLHAALDAVDRAGVVPAALLLTGDLAEDGAPATYRRLHEMLAGRPFVCAAGNHDDRAALREHLLGLAPSDEPLDHVTRLGGLRVIVLDSTVPGAAHGVLVPQQLARLAAELATPAPDGTVLVLHHPPLPSPSRLATSIQLQDRNGLGEVIAGTDVRIVLAGHTHVPSAGTLAGVPVWVGGSTSSTWYGLAPTGESGVRVPFVSRIDLFDDGSVLASAVPLGAPGLGEIDPARIDELVAAADRRQRGGFTAAT